MSKGRFKLDTTITSSPSTELATLSPSTSSSFGEFQATTTPPLPAPVLYGDFAYDLSSKKYNKSWPSWKEFEEFLATEETTHSIELRRARSNQGGDRYLWRVDYVCSRHGTGGEKSYQKKNPDWERKIPSKRTQCKAHLTVKTYFNTKTVLGIYETRHDHPLGNENLRFTRISDETREWIAGMVRMKVQSDHIVRVLPFFIFHLFKLHTARHPSW